MSRLIFTLIIGAVLTTSLAAASGAEHIEQPNVLLVIVDDLSTDLRTYGNREVHTPNFDR